MVQAVQAADPSRIAGFHAGTDSGITGIALQYDYTLAVPAKKKTQGGPGKDTSGRAAFDWMTANTKQGVISVCHIGDIAGSANLNYSMAVFLSAASELTWFAFSSAEKAADDPAWEACSAGAGSTWPSFPTWCSGMGYTPEYDQPLGAPDGPAVKTQGKKTVDEVTRSFGGGKVKVVVDLQGDTCEISWSDGSFTTCGGKAGQGGI